MRGFRGRYRRSNLGPHLSFSEITAGSQRDVQER
jgi:hypothetical protein